MQEFLLNKKFFPGLIFIFLLLYEGLAFCQSINESEKGSFTIDGYLSGKYTFKATGEETDQDIYGELRLDMTSPARKYEFHILGALKQDIDGNRERTLYYPLEDIGDAYRASILGYLYEGNVVINEPFTNGNFIKIGRQAGGGDEAIYFDGINIDANILSNLKIAVYGGSAIHFYEIDSHWDSDWLGGISLNYSIHRNTNLNLEYLYIEDKRNIFSSNDREDHLVSFKIWQQFDPFFKAMTRLRYVNGESRDLTIRAIKTFPELQMELSGNYLRQLHTQKELSNELSTYYDVMGESKPYETYDIKARKLFTDQFALDLSYSERRLIEDGDEGPFNREYRRMSLTTEVKDIPVHDLTFTISGEIWEANNRKFKSAGFDAGYTFGSARKSRINIGNYYSLYKYDYYIELGEREEVMTYYIKLKMPFTRQLTIDTSFEYEDSLENYKIFKIGMRYDF